MKKRGMILAIMIVCACFFTACGVTHEKTSNEYMTAKEAISEGENYTGQISQIYTEYSSDLNTFYQTCKQKNSSDALLIMNAVKSWDAARKELGDTITVEQGSSKAAVSDDSITVMVKLQGSKTDKDNQPRTAWEKIVFTKTTPSEFSTAIQYSAAEKVQQSGAESAAGFLTLAAIALILGLTAGLAGLLTRKHRSRTEASLSKKETNAAIDHAIQNIVQKEEAQITRENEEAGEDGKSRICAGVAGKVIRVCAVPGQNIKRGEPVVILETMKMEIPQVAQKDGTIEKIMVAAGEICDAGDVLALSD